VLLTNKAIVVWNSANKKWYESKGYKFTYVKDSFEVDINDLSRGSNSRVDVKCDGVCGNILSMQWSAYLKYVHEDDKYFCTNCANKLYVNKKRIKTLIQNNQSFYDWCINNNRQDVLSRWDSNLNKCYPQDVSYSSNKKYWFTCPKGIHSSEPKRIANFIKGHEKTINCKQCDSIGQNIINLYGEKSLELYWDYSKNINLDGELIDPFSLSKNSIKKIYIYCQNHKYHGSNAITPHMFSQGQRCPYCGTAKIHKYDSIGWKYPQVFDIWSDKNIKSPYEYKPHSKEKVYWKCSNNEHKDYKRKISESYDAEFRCPTCNFSKGEKEIEKYLKANEIKFISQMEFKELIGLKGGNLSYDFYVPQHNVLLEYDGEFHYQPIRGKERFNRQNTHDKLKDEYAKNNKIKLIRIPYWDFDNIKEILDKELIMIQDREAI
jgi:very-short-patch-repair endonuclease